jgi:formate C-acetyltransferase
MEPVGEHFSPVPGRAVSGPTAVIRSATKSPLAEAVGVAIFHVGLSRDMAPRNPAGAALVKSLLQAGLKMGATVMNTAIYDIETLKAAKAHPENYADLIVRVWGYSARFVGLSEEMQDHIIARAVRGE